jgi:formylglycine-generating enzyme required for sulfatase activity
MAATVLGWTLAFLLPLSTGGCFTRHAEPVHYTNSAGIKLILIPGGNFMMGSPPAEDGRFDSEGPVHEVYLDAFYTGEKEITVGQWKKFMEETDHHWDKWSQLREYAPGDDYPVVFINWPDAEAFCRWLSTREGKTYRLPTEAEWEKAARGGLGGRKYPWGDKPPDGSQCNFADRQTDFPWSDKSIDDGFAYPAPVGSFPPNGYGLYDMAGNVWEWCQDWFDWDYYKISPASNPTGAFSGIDRSIRGGSWSNDANTMRCAFRGFIFPVVPSHPRGFRIVMEP